MSTPPIGPHAAPVPQPATGPVTGPLDGATRVRPDGWLATPLTTSPGEAEDQARELLAHHDIPQPVTIRCLTARYRTAAFAVGDPPDRLLKRHADHGAFLGEVLAYDLAGPGVLPTLHSVCDQSRTLLVEYLDTPADLHAPGTFNELIAAAATIHTASSRWDTATAEVMAPFQVGAALAAATPGWITDPVAWRNLLRLVGAAHGTTHVPLGQLDLKADHARRHPDGRLAIIDAETLRPDLTGMPDLITLAWLARNLGLPHTGPAIRRTYLDRVNELDAAWTDTALIAALHAFADATGLHRLHQVAA